MLANIWPPIYLSITVAASAWIIVILSGVLLGKAMAGKSFKGKLIIETLLMLPLVLPPTVIGFLLIIVFGKRSPVGQFIELLFQQPVIFTWWAAVLASSVVAFPLMYQSAKTGFEAVDHDIENAARVDGAGKWNVFFFITIPLSYTSIVSGAILSFARALGEFGATLMFAGNIPGRTQTIPTAIYLAIDSGDMKEAWILVLASIVISFAMLTAAYRIKRY
ncbi:molybdate ABC transporter permease subunit [Fictibacillus enclensis]|uniref:Molybdenum transport system permease n=1 Tax=Fictibacillus enclensis TaxID=1017270 RepID=A0A0V8JAW8_9BACL|nr:MULTISPECIES: molybdate ABC transporter permease subunit [Fictibacillus]KSU84058.1 molybdenum ABC transporter permease [Fictibacillus enclensis]MDM5336799.1 molybdate ABC transporter permease subunit [Fictibacillus enclensis]RXZ00334.1 molybdate ABC transporter permease subunit [Fictibacillus sp. S7]WHY73228.1 molybdate ABC transporter permease subunit [Fictibacillus enclensis]SCB72462.1 molybdate transport system permease protein [Fictibacillus enclensis]